MALLDLAVGLLFLVAGAELAVRGALGLARHWGWPSWLTGLLLLALGTSLPELFVSSMAAPHHPELAFGNVFGSNVFNVGGVLGVALVLAGRRGLPASGWRGPGAIGLLVASVVAAAALWPGGRIAPWLGAMLLLSYLVVVRNALRGGRLHAQANAATREIEPNPVLKGLLMLAGFALLAWASSRFLDGALALAARLGWSDGFAGYLIAAVGTSAPELFTSLRAIRHGHAEAVYGNVLGSNVFNLLVVGGAASLLASVPVAAGTVRPQALANLAAAILLLALAPAARSGRFAAPLGWLLIAGYLLATWRMEA